MVRVNASCLPGLHQYTALNIENGTTLALSLNQAATEGMVTDEAFELFEVTMIDCADDCRSMD